MLTYAVGAEALRERGVVCARCNFIRSICQYTPADISIH
jgi:hypothetical protein